MNSPGDRDPDRQLQFLLNLVDDKAFIDGDVLEISDNTWATTARSPSTARSSWPSSIPTTRHGTHSSCFVAPRARRATSRSDPRAPRRPRPLAS